MSTKLKAFLAFLDAQVENHSIYVWGAQGQHGKDITEDWIRRREKQERNASRAIAFWKKQVKGGYGNKLRAFDCSGLGVYFFMQNGLLKHDTTADGLLKLSTRIEKEQLRPGDFVFHVHANGKAYHVGYVVDAALNIIEAKGRDAGVVKSPLKGWNAYGRPPFWGEEIMNRILKLTNPYMRGADVLSLQKALVTKGYPAGKTDCIFGPATERALKAFQAAAKLTVDGKAGPLTLARLGVL